MLMLSPGMTISTPSRQLDGAGDIRRPDIELGFIAVEERGMPAAFLLAQDVDLGLGIGMRLDGAGGRQHHAALDIFTLDASEQHADGIAGLGLVQHLVEHFQAGDDDLPRFMVQADDLNLVADLDHAALHPAGGHGAAALDAEDIFHVHQEGLVLGALRAWE